EHDTLDAMNVACQHCGMLPCKCFTGGNSIPRLPNPPLHASVADIPEGELVEKLMADRRWRASLLGIQGIPATPRVFQRVDLRRARSGFTGDADIILVAPDNPGVATAIEVKRIKVGASAFDTGQPNKLQEYEKAV